MKVAVYDTKGTKKEDQKLNDKVFGLDVNKALLSEVVILLQSNLRQGTAKTKERGEISGGGRKPWKQKGTGRARTGSIRNPIWRGGGTVFGPTGEQNWYKNIPAKKGAAALLNALSAKAKDGQIVVLKDLNQEKPKTKDLAEVLNKLKVAGKILLVLPEANEIIFKAGKNIPNLKIEVANNLNTLEVMLADTIILANGAEDKMERLAK
ncbi:TPA: 50S ribosomal protein L4 [candidate division CPR2 bacterium]|uniref:Large ribosomal subunit protein uL4 n=1 Tax=candidate division CPR2 bacterium GW2011_GWC1_41_48 TaxID=1618344 RepID=A0A0G0Z733_UNCC2|nr:MAG: 50S ribosomal protein L4 [candidate division CPR2 bacterium GW2011_GWC2_39_35]KKR27152.1 MAG: 50S ribosomal protein L4 [candidate division CPR2 bacterium GW2011_GWD2_39_7]KKR27707.1 MAG: 50S ribosomal protein L4 [candidate division CPR2 bacterium GW2011_GWD1_39_7]KKS08838.1 MAG: 50S ribosomal protein L4 [candidate division CPR2 bacterium GW2011_GWC1_41_48]OGB59766.1 MAG: 50S ribosomal protein L4 [candidate division CPR2 bacterium GWD1_39_7]OGB70301.1 MAG: 50S ribosomal protein L4 [cand